MARVRFNKLTKRFEDFIEVNDVGFEAKDKEFCSAHWTKAAESIKGR